MKSKSINIKWLEYKGEIKKTPLKKNYEILHNDTINMDEYKKLYKDVGKNYSWLGRLNISND